MASCLFMIISTWAPPSSANLSEKILGFSKDFLARDLDGHGLQIIEP